MERLFKGQTHAQLYASYRPSYPEDIFTSILNYHSGKCGYTELAIDVGCGTGLSTVALAPYFDKVIGVDVSEAQLSQALVGPENVSFKVASCYEMGFLESGSVDVITVACTLHWLDKDKLYREAKRVLRPNGTLAIYSYELRFQLDSEEATKIIIEEMYDGTIGKAGHDYHGTNLHYLFSENFTMPFKDFKRIPDIQMTRTWSLDQLSGYIKTLSGYQAYMKQHPDSMLMGNTMSRLKQIYGEDTGKPVVHIKWATILVLGRN